MLKSRLPNAQAKKATEQGFTLIELSIVLVIIGLIVGGILTGQDLIKAAEQRATLAQVEKYNTAVNTFRNKFGGLPGDLPWATANTFGLMPGGVTALTAGGNGDGLITGSGADPFSFAGEPVLFWQQLSRAGLIDGSFGDSTVLTSTAGVIAANITTASAANNYMPAAKLARSNSINVITGSGLNYFVISGFGVAASGTPITATAGLYGIQTNDLNPLESYSMDKKVDDGLPDTGSWVAVSLATTPTQATIVTTPAPIAACVASSAYVYTTSTPQCSLRIRFN